MTIGVIAEGGELRLRSPERKAFVEDAISARTINGHILEFGVGAGVSLWWIARAVDQTVYGFDSFEGIPENWQFNDSIIFAKGSFKYNPDQIPKRSNMELVKGWFEDTIPKWKADNPGAISFLHIDADLYSSCKTVLTELNHQIVPGTILLFDELLNYPRWEEGEWKAFVEWQQEYGRKVHELGTNWTQASYRIIE